MSHVQEEPGRRVRSIYTVRSDRPIYAAFGKYTFLTAELAAEITGRPMKRMQKRFQHLFEAAHLKRTRLSPYHPYVYWLDMQGVRYAYANAIVDSTNRIISKAPSRLEHEMGLTKFRRCLDLAMPGEVESYVPWDEEISDKIETPEGILDLTPDRYMTLRSMPQTGFFLENELSHGGFKKIKGKLEFYVRYRPTFREKYGREDFRVLFLYPTLRRIERLFEDIDDRFRTRRFWFTDRESYEKNPFGKIWFNPKDLGDTTHSLIEKAE